MTVKDVREISFYLLDMDGTIYLGERLIDGAREFLNTLRDQGKGFVFLTNNSSKNRHTYREKLERMGVSVTPDDIFTSGEATALYLKKKSPGAKIFLLGTSMLAEDFTGAGFTTVEKKEPDYVVLGFDTTLTYDKLWRACDYIREGVSFIATHPDLNCPLGEGKYMPDAGAIIKFIEASTGKSPLVIGKPNRYMVDCACEKYGADRDKMAITGDRLYTDIRLGANAQITSILVFSGETNPKDYRCAPDQATFVYPSVKELKEALSD